MPPQGMAQGKFQGGVTTMVPRGVGVVPSRKPVRLSSCARSKAVASTAKTCDRLAAGAAAASCERSKTSDPAPPPDSGGVGGPSSASGRYVAVAPARAVDTRSGQGCPSRVPAGGRLDLKVPVFLRRGLDGNILESEMVEDSSAVNITFQLVYLNNFITSVGYSNFFDGGENTYINDRDNVSLTVSYSF